MRESVGQVRYIIITVVRFLAFCNIDGTSSIKEVQWEELNMEGWQDTRLVQVGNCVSYSKYAPCELLYRSPHLSAETHV